MNKLSGYFLLLLCGASLVTAERCTNDSVAEEIKAMIDQKLSPLQDQLKEIAAYVAASTGNSVSRRGLGSSGPWPRDCADLQSLGKDSSGVYAVYVGSMLRPVQVYCDMTTDGGGWTVFQRRKDGSEDFYRKWPDYARGFGRLNGEFWLGNDNLHAMTAVKGYVLRVDLADFSDNSRFAEYTNFKVGSACQKYKLTSLGTYYGNAGDGLTHHVGMKFSTPDQDNDLDSSKDCAVAYKGAWWYKYCHLSNINGMYLKGQHSSYADGVNWYYWKGYYYSLKFTEMKIRPCAL